MFGLSPTATATIVLIAVTVSFPCFLYGAWLMIDNDPITWSVLVTHLKYVLLGLTLTTVPLLFWMLPRLFSQMTGFAALHAVLGLNAYAFLAFALTGIVRIFRAKRRYDLYHDYDQDLLLEEIGGENMDHWRSRLRIGVVGYVILWLFAYLAGFGRYVVKYDLANF